MGPSVSCWRAGPMVPGGGQRVQRSMPGCRCKGCILRCADSWRCDGNPLESSTQDTALWSLSAAWRGLLRCKDSPSLRLLLRSTVGGSGGGARCSWAARFLPITLGSFPWSEPHRRLKRSGSRRKKARRGHLRALWGSGLGATRARHFTDQRLLIGSTSRRSAPVNSWRGRPILYSGSPIISFSWAIQPTVRASAKMAVNSDTGMPMARCTMPE